MKKLQRFILIGLVWLVCQPALWAQTYSRLWKQVEQAEQDNLPQSAVRLADSIYRKAMREQHIGQLLKSYVYREERQRMLTPDSLYSQLAALERWAASERQPEKQAVLYSLLAGRYADYAESHRSLLKGRTDLDVETLPTDVREWSYNLFEQQIERCCRASLAHPDLLLKASSHSYRPFTEQGAASRFYRNDLYHLLAQRAVRAYDACGRRIALTDSLYRTMQAHYARCGNNDAVVMTLLEYWKWEWQHSDWQQRKQTYPMVLQRYDSLMQIYAARPVGAEVYIHQAQFMQESGEATAKEIVQLCRTAVRKHASYGRIAVLRNMLGAYTQPRLHVSLPAEAYPGDSALIQVRYRLAGGFRLDVYETELPSLPLEASDNRPPSSCRRLRKVASRHFRLDVGHPDRIYQDSTVSLKMKMPDKAGMYLLDVVPDVPVEEGRLERLLSVTRFKVLSLRLPDGQLELYALDGESGHPAPEATVAMYLRQDEGAWTLQQEQQADSMGLTRWRVKSGQECHYRVYKGDDRYMRLCSGFHPRQVFAGQPRTTNILLLTDRTLFRPGQTVHVKGISYVQQGDSGCIVADVPYEVCLVDAAHGKEISRQPVRTNEFGSFVADFVLPAVCMNGPFLLRVRDRNGRWVGEKSVRVEEYRRPTFEIELQPLSEAYRAGSRVQIQGRVKTYNGVVAARWPVACSVRLQRWRTTVSDLKADTVYTDADGHFSMSYTLPAAETGLYAEYVIEASVTDEAGATQSTQMHVPFSASVYQLGVNLQRNVICKEDSLCCTFSVSNMQGVPQDVTVLVSFRRQDGETVYEGRFRSNLPQDCSAWRRIPSGCYQLQCTVEEKAEEGKCVWPELTLFSRSDKRLPCFMESFGYRSSAEFDETHPGRVWFGTSYKDVCVWMNVWSRQQRVERRLFCLSDSLVCLEFPDRAAYGDNVQVELAFVKGGRLYGQSFRLARRKSDPSLRMKWEVFRDRLQPGQQEEWRLVVNTPQGTPAAAEVLAMMYDASLDRIYSQEQRLQLLRPSGYIAYPSCRLSPSPRISHSFSYPYKTWPEPAWQFDSFYNAAPIGRSYLFSSVKNAGWTRMDLAAPVAAKMQESVMVTKEEADGEAQEVSVTQDSGMPRQEQPAEQLRSDFNETAFFYPQLRTDSAGRVAFSFVMPQSLAHWNFRSYAHTHDLAVGMLGDEAVTEKKLMLNAALPRFVRAGDRTWLTATVTNASSRRIEGSVRLVLFDPMTEKELLVRKRKLDVGVGQNTTVAFEVEVDERHPLLGIRLVADGGDFSDGEQHLLPVLSNKQQVTEALPLTIRGKERRTFTLDSLFNRRHPSAMQRRLTVEFCGNPLWYAIQALPSLVQPASDNTLGWATAWYANSLAAHILRIHPHIQTVMKAWKMSAGNRETLLSRLQKNQELRNILLDESPWLLDAVSEAEQRARLYTLFDDNLLAARTAMAVDKLASLQAGDGSWSWYPGMRASRYITTYVTELLLRFSLLTGHTQTGQAGSILRQALDYLHREALREYEEQRRIGRTDQKPLPLSTASLDYLYLVALSGEQLPQSNRALHRHYLSLLVDGLPGADADYLAKGAVILQKNGLTAEAARFRTALREHLVGTDESGSGLVPQTHFHTWNMQPVAVHVHAMEAFRLADSGTEDISLLEEMKTWLLRQKQTQSWRSPVATADAVYALLADGDARSLKGGEVRVELGGTLLTTQAGTTSEAQPVPGLNYIKQTYVEGSSVLKARQVRVEKLDDGMGWGAVYAQYLAPMSDLKQHGNGLSVEKQLYVERMDSTGHRSLIPLPMTASGGPASHPAVLLSLGDKVVSRLVIRLDRDMDFVQLKDMRTACLEPVSTLSGYRWQQGLGYYMEVEDAGTNFFFDHLDKGVYVLEHRSRIERKGIYTIGLATLQCAYAPEFVSHAAGGTLDGE